MREFGTDKRGEGISKNLSDAICHTQEILATREREVANDKKLLPHAVPLLHVAVRVPGRTYRSRCQTNDLCARPREFLVVSQNPPHFLLRLL